MNIITLLIIIILVLVAAHLLIRLIPPTKRWGSGLDVVVYVLFIMFLVIIVLKLLDGGVRIDL